MAEHKVSGGTMLLFIDPNGGTTYDTVVCLKSVGVSDSINPIDTSSWCGSGKLPGLLNISYTFDGFHIQDVDTGRISGTDLRILLRNKTKISWKIAPESPVGGDEIQTGFGFISQLSSNYSFDNVGDFSMTVEVKGIPTTTIESAYTGGFTFVNDNEGFNNPYKFILFSSAPITANIYTIYGDYEINSVPDITFGYACIFIGYNTVSEFNVNFNVDDPSLVTGIDVICGDIAVECYRVKDLNISNFHNLINIFITYQKLTTSNVDLILSNLISDGNMGGIMFVLNQYPSISPNGSYIGILTSTYGWAIL